MEHYEIVRKHQRRTVRKRRRRARVASVLVLVTMLSALTLLIGARMTGQPEVEDAEKPVEDMTSKLKSELDAQAVYFEERPAEEIAADEATTESWYIAYDVPLSEELQHYTQDVCEEYGVSYPLVLAIIEKESTFQPSAVSSTHDYGLMQINQMNHEWLEGVLGITDWLDPKQNILAGVYVLSQFDYEDLHQVLMSYNCGPTGAKNLWADGVYSTAYSRAVVEILDGLEVMTNE